MRIVELRTFVVGNPPPRIGGRYFLFLKLVTDNGIEGVGEVYTASFGPKAIVAMIEDVFAHHVEGADPFEIETLWRNVYGRGYSLRPDISLMGVLSGVEMAMWDIVGKAVDKPVYALLGGKANSRLRSYTYLYPEGGADVHSDSPVYSDPDAAAARAVKYVAEGFTAVKFDPAGPYSTFDPRQPSLERLSLSEAFCKKIRAAVGDKCDLLFGTHGQFTVSGAKRLAQRLEPYSPLWFEEPTPPEMPEEMARVAASTTIPIAAGERLTTKYEFSRVLEMRRRLDPANGSRPRRRPFGGQEDRGNGGSALCADRPASLLRPDRRRRQHPARRVQPEFPDPRKPRTMGRLCRQVAEEAYSLGKRLCHSSRGAGPRRRTRRGRCARASLYGRRAASDDDLRAGRCIPQ